MARSAVRSAASQVSGPVRTSPTRRVFGTGGPLVAYDRAAEDGRAGTDAGAGVGLGLDGVGDGIGAGAEAEVGAGVGVRTTVSRAVVSWTARDRRALGRDGVPAEASVRAVTALSGAAEEVSGSSATKGPIRDVTLASVHRSERPSSDSRGMPLGVRPPWKYQTSPCASRCGNARL